MRSDTVRRCQVYRLPTAHPADTSGVLGLIASGTIVATDIRAIFGKTEGNGCVNDFTRAYAVTALRHALAGQLGCAPAEVGHRVAMVMSGGTEGGLSPHLLVFTVSDAQAGSAPTHSLAIGTAFTRAFQPEEIGRTPQIEATA
jgi:cyanuric acid amidohydrolase